jgi:two-component system, cell cycle response regulator
MTSGNLPCKVLVIDACSETQASIQSCAHGRGISLLAVSDPASAWSAIDRAVPEVVVTDLFLPGGGGLALAKELRRRHELCPVIVMAKDAPNSVVVEALRAGAVDFLHKPITEERLAHALCRARHLLPSNVLDQSGVRRWEHRMTMDSDPVHVPGVISWLVKTTASTLPDIQRLHLRGALQELLLNAVEHGNLEIPYRVKEKALAKGEYESLIRGRLAQSRYTGRQVAVHVLYEREARSLVYRIADEGAGFHWRSLLAQPQEACRTDAENGRGIFLTRSLFPNLAYNDRGNEVMFTVTLG